MHRLISLLTVATFLLIGGVPAQSAANYTGGANDIMFSTGTSIKAYAFRMKTTQATSNAAPLAQANGSSSRSGWDLLLNNTANKLALGCKDASNYVLLITGTTTVNDGNWHDVVLNIDYASGGTNEIWVDGVLDATGTASGAWGGNTALQIGQPSDTFWAAYSGSLAEIAGFDAKLTSDQVKALHAGFPAPRVGHLLFYMPLIRDRNELIRSLGPTTTGTPTVVDHPRVVGGR